MCDPLAWHAQQHRVVGTGNCTRTTTPYKIPDIKTRARRTGANASVWVTERYVCGRQQWQVAHLQHSASLDIQGDATQHGRRPMAWAIGKATQGCYHRGSAKLVIACNEAGVWCVLEGAKWPKWVICVRGSKAQKRVFDGTRTRNLPLRRRMPYPLGHEDSTMRRPPALQHTRDTTLEQHKHTPPTTSHVPHSALASVLAWSTPRRTLH